MTARPGVPRWALLAFLCLGPLGWAMFWAVFHTVPGQDWVVFHTAAALVRAGDWRTLADGQAFTAVLNRTHAAWLGQALKFHPWVYPPVTLLLALLFGWMSYPISLVSFLLSSLGAFVAALWPWARDARDRPLLIGLVLLCPATAFTLGAGQMSFLVAALVLAGVLWLPARPFLGGACLGLLCLKPQFAPMIPVALLAGRHWRAVLGAALSVASLVLASLVLVGGAAWVDWLRLAWGANPARGELVDAVRLYDQSVHTCLRVLGAGATVAALGQAAAVLLGALCVWRAFASPMAQWRRLAVLLCALVWSAPHVGDYDEIMVAVAAIMVLLARPSRLAALFACGAWLATLFNPPALIAVVGVPALTLASAATPLLVAGLMLACGARAAEASNAAPPHRAIM